MSSISLKNLSVTFFGESHGVAVGGVITGLPAGKKIDYSYITKDMERRRAKNSKISTPRKEEDIPHIISGVYNGYTTGAPLCVIIENKNVMSKDYDNLENTLRPSHSDYGAFLKYKGYNDKRGGGHFSGRLTAPVVAIGSICKSILNEEDIYIGGHLKNIGEIKDKSLYDIDLPEVKKIRDKEIPTILDIGDEVIEKIDSVRRDKNSIGGIVECGIYNMKKGIGGPLFSGVEGKLANLLYGIPAVKGVEFGIGFSFAEKTGREVNDEFKIEDNKIKQISNNCGGILGGITTGEPIILSVAFKPTPSIASVQKSVDVDKMEEKELEIKGRHDPAVVLRAVPVCESVLAIGILDMIL